MKNYELLLVKLSQWLKKDGKLFVHIFTHKWYRYHFEDGWMAKTFLTGGTMLSKELLLRFNNDLVVEKQWAVNGTHYSRTLEEWVKNIAKNSNEFKAICAKAYGKENAAK